MPSENETIPSRPGTNPYSTLSKVLATLVAVLAVALALSPPLRSVFSKSSNFLPKQLSRNMATASAVTSTSTSTGTSTSPALSVVKRPWNARGHADHGWLYTFHTFSFASYHDPRFESFGPLRVINEDRVERGTGFGKHSHAEFLIWSYIVSGELEHRDSMGNLENLRRGEVQFTSAGTGISHSEYCRNEREDVHFLQIWAKPNVRGLKPSYKTSKFSDEEKTDRLCRVMESVDRHKTTGDAESGPIAMHADLSMDASILGPGKTVVHEAVTEGKRNVYVHLVMTGKTQPKTGGAKIKVGDQVLGEGDGAFIKLANDTRQVQVESVGDKAAEFLLFDMSP